ncbi:MAG: hypothetical protein GVY20_06445, partial [Bacteroidetes bacterium]|nr:hypothetical protein [Bacteroidota bacterium]
DAQSEEELHDLLSDYLKQTGSETAAHILDNWDRKKRHFIKLVPVGVLKRMEEEAPKKVAS